MRDRADGKLIKDIDGLHNIMIDLKPRRCDADVYISEKIDVTELVKFIEKNKNKDDKKLTYFHAFTYALAKVFYERPLLNRFICDRKTYQRNDVIIAFVAKVAFDEKSEEMMINIDCNKDDNIFDLRDQILNKVSKVRNSNSYSEQGNTNDMVSFVGNLPKLIRVPVVGFYKWLDKKGFLPLSMMKDNIYYSSAIISNLGNLGISSVYHNLTNFGTSSIIMTIGEIYEETKIDKNGKKYTASYCDFGINCDERISDGYYFAKGVKVFEKVLKNPELLTEPLSKNIEEKLNE